MRCKAEPLSRCDAGLMEVKVPGSMYTILFIFPAIGHAQYLLVLKFRRTLPKNAAVFIRCTSRKQIQLFILARVRSQLLPRLLSLIEADNFANLRHTRKPSHPPICLAIPA